MTKKKYSFKDHPEHKEMLPIWRNKWIANAMSTKLMDNEDRSRMRVAIKGLYIAANLTPPPDERIVFVSSPLMARFAGGYASAIWWLRKNPNNKFNLHDATDAATRDATRAATRDATYAATRDATHAATRAATDAATDDATRDATRAATYAATDAATYAATRAATRAATYAATDAATRDATRAATHAATRAATRAATDAATDDATRDATRAATHAATHDATYAATDAATRDATRAATRDATYAATDDATHAATRAATRDATYAATRDATYAATDDATHAATRAATDDATDNKNWYSSVAAYVSVGISLKLGNFGFKCCYHADRMYQGGNQWSAWDSMLSFFKNVAKLDIDYSKYEHWETAAQHGSYRIMHPKFCIISDRPKTLKVDDQNRPHCEDGPFCEWRDGMKLYSWHGVRIPQWWIENKEALTPGIALKETNLELRRIACEIIGWKRIVEELGGITIDEDKDPQIGKLVEVNLPDSGKERFLFVQCGTMRSKEKYHFALAVPPTMKTALEANAWSYFLEPAQYAPEIRT